MSDRIVRSRGVSALFCAMRGGVERGSVVGCKTVWPALVYGFNPIEDRSNPLLARWCLGGQGPDIKHVIAFGTNVDPFRG